MRARDFLYEYDQAKTIDNFESALYLRASGQRQVDDGEGGEMEVFDHNLEDRRGQQLLGLKNQKLYYWGEKIIEFFENIDPTHGKFVLPMINWYLRNEMRSLEDAPKLRGPIATYVKFRNRIKGLNLKTITFDQFLDAMEAQEGKLSASDADKAEEQAFYDNKDAVLVHNSEHMKIVLLRTMAASCYFGKNTRWCTTSRDKNENMFNSYASDGPLFVILDKANNKRWQFHFDLGQSIALRQIDHQFMDEKDQPVEPFEVMGGDAFDAIFDWACNTDGADALVNTMEEIKEGGDPSFSDDENYDSEEMERNHWEANFGDPNQGDLFR